MTVYHGKTKITKSQAELGLITIINTKRYDLHQFMLQEDWGKMKLKEPGRQQLQRLKHLPQMKASALCSDLLRQCFLFIHPLVWKTLLEQVRIQHKVSLDFAEKFSVKSKNKVWILLKYAEFKILSSHTHTIIHWHTLTYSIKIYVCQVSNYIKFWNLCILLTL